MRGDWSDLPVDVRDAVEAQTGPVQSIEPAAAGNHADIASSVEGAGGRVFVKAAKKLEGCDGPEVISLRWESLVNPYVAEFAPRLLFKEETEGWLALGFEHVEGRPADFTPGSPDLEILAKTVDALQVMECPDVLANKRIERRWEPVTNDVRPMSGDALLHSDLNPANFIISDERIALVDWTFAARGAAWVELGLLMPWLLKAGHDPAQAEEWLSQFGSWSDASADDLDLFAGVFAAKWKINIAKLGEQWAFEHAAAAQQWADHRSG